jgi:hypothetical protein
MSKVQWPFPPTFQKTLVELIERDIAPLSDEDQAQLLEYLLLRRGQAYPPGNYRLLVQVVIAEASVVQVMRVPPNCLVYDLTCELLERLSLQTIGPNGQIISYGIIAHPRSGESRVLDLFATLEEQGVQSGSDLILFPQVDA